MFNESKVYSLSELSKVIQESTKEYKPVVGKDVIKDDAQNNVKAVKDIMKQVSEYDGGQKETKRKTNPENIEDLNKTTLDVDFAYEPSKEYKERVKSQVHGFPSVENEKNSDIKENESLDFDGNEEFYDNNKEKNKEVNKVKTDVKHAGLKSHNLPKENYKNKSAFTESKTMKRLRFKNTIFLNETEMLKKIPEDYKKDGNKFYMQDSKGTEYLIECVKDKNVDFIYTNVLNMVSPTLMTENFEKINKLSNYDSASYFKGSTNESRIAENDALKKMLDKVKKLEEDSKK